MSSPKDDNLSGIDGAGRRKARGLFTRFLADETAATAVEFGIIAAPFFALLGAILELAICFLAAQILDTATAESARLIRTGQAQQAAMDKATFTSQVCSRLYVLFDCSKVYVESTVYGTFAGIGNQTSYSTYMDGSGNFDPTKVTTFNMGAGSAIVVVRVFYAYPTIFKSIGFDIANTADGKLLMTGVAVFRNEPFPWT